MTKIADLCNLPSGWKATFVSTHSEHKFVIAVHPDFPPRMCRLEDCAALVWRWPEINPKLDG